MSKKRLVLLYFADRQRHLNSELVSRFGWAWNQRKNIELKQAGIRIDGEMINGNTAAWEYWLVTPNEDIDFEKCCLKPESDKPAPAAPPVAPVVNVRQGEMLKTEVKIYCEKSGQMVLV
ncbi:MAG: hypothetical protein PHC43_02650 [Candidatus Marinimicrobia bacterium]|nr:hypothetical protein [Candidatus Neomarinimicrobiota bacterium]